VFSTGPKRFVLGEVNRIFVNLTMPAIARQVAAGVKIKATPFK
jgi:hypothetical protein